MRHDSCDGAIQQAFFSDPEEMLAALAEEIAARLADGIAARGRASFVAAGGRTPAALYMRLAQAGIEWDKVHVTLSDELWIAPDRDGSNEKRIRDTLLTGKARSAHFHPLKTPHATAEAAEAAVGRAIARMPRPFDFCLLGMGVDGHIASLCPYADGLAQALDARDPAPVRAIRPRDAGAGLRLSLTLGAITGSRRIAILIRGAEKKAALARALSGDDAQEMPVRAVLGQRITPLGIHWAP